MTTIGERIKAAREARGFTQQTLARAMRISRGAVSNWEAGKGVSRENLMRVADITGASIEWLMTGQGGSGVQKEPDEELPRAVDLPLDVEFLTALLSATFVAIGLSPDKGQFLARAVIGAARRPQSERSVEVDDDLARRVAAALSRAIQ